MKALGRYLKQNKHLFLLLYAVIYIPWFIWLEKTVTTDFHLIHMAVDDRIPFCEFFVIPYYFWFIYMAVGIIFIAFTDGGECRRMGLFLITGMTVFLVVSTVYPNGHDLRPTEFARDNFCVDIVRRLYASDTPTNLFPSIHVYNSLGIHFALLHSKLLKGRKKIKILSFCLMLSIILSTVFIKQHSVFDVLTALALAALMYALAWGKPGEMLRQRMKRKTLRHAS